MKIGDYVRTKDYGIHKITNFVVFDDIEYIVDNNSMYYTKIDKREIIKSSPNIIDLIEVGDYVNGFKVKGVYKPEGTYVLWLTLSCNPIEVWKNEDIKSIVTKEQFEAMKYEIK